MRTAIFLKTGSLALLVGMLLTACAPDLSGRKGTEALIVGGGLVAAENLSAEASATVALTSRALRNEGRAFCSGTLIARDVVLTAAHCLADASGMGFAWEASPQERERLLPLLVSFGNVGEAEFSEVRAVGFHSAYQAKAVVDPLSTAWSNDLALVLLKSPAPPNRKPASFSRDAFKEGTGVSLLGYGLTVGPGLPRRRFPDDSGLLRRVEVKVSPGLPGQEGLQRGLFWTLGEPLPRAPEESFRQGACNGDSGGPAFMRESGVWKLRGVLSAGFTSASGRCAGSNAYSDTLAHTRWIEAATLELYGAALEGRFSTRLEGLVPPPPAGRDLDGNPYRDEIELALNVGLVPTYDDGWFRPYHAVTREQAVASLLTTLALASGDFVPDAALSRSPFSDVPVDLWSASRIALASRLGLIAGYPDGTFAPHNAVSRAELMAAVVKGLDALEKRGKGLSRNRALTPSRFSDLEGHWAAGAVAMAEERCGIPSAPDGKGAEFHPSSPVTRDFLASVLIRLHGCIVRP